MKKAWIITVDMGYGHQRAAYPLKNIAYERIITANSDKIVTPDEKKMWEKSQSFYEWVSRMTAFPIIGKYIFRTYDKLQSISPYYPFRDLSKPNYSVTYLNSLVKKGLCRSVVEYTKKKSIPFVTTHFIPALAAENAGVKKIFCVVTDTDINRVWAPEEPEKSRIIYLASSEKAVNRLAEYGVNKKNIIFTGFPLPKENTGKGFSVLKKDLGNRLPNLDPGNRYLKHLGDYVKSKLGKGNLKSKSDHPLTLTFMVGGAGAQKEFANDFLLSLKKKILECRIKINLVAGTRLEIAQYFNDLCKDLGLYEKKKSLVDVIYALDKKTYFEKVNNVLRKTDIIWTKPSEMSFYTALGLPIIIAPPIGAHEHYNKKWLMHMGTGFAQEDPKYTNEWLFDWLYSGRLAEAAFEGFLKAPKEGTEKIEKLI